MFLKDTQIFAHNLLNYTALEDKRGTDDLLPKAVSHKTDFEAFAFMLLLFKLDPIIRCPEKPISFGFGFSDPIDYRLNLFLSAAIDEALKQQILGENPFRLFDY